MSNYWTATNKIPIEQTTISIPATNGTNHSPTQEVRFTIDPSVKFFYGAESYVEWDVRITPPFSSVASQADSAAYTQACYLGLDAETGGQSLIRTMRIRDLASGTLLEEIDGYNTMVALKYDYNTNDSLRNKRALTECSTAYDHRTRGTTGTTMTQANSYINNPYFTQDVGGSTTRYDAGSTSNFIDAKMTLPLHSGIFQNSKIFPNSAVGGLEITLLLEDTYRSLRTMDGSNKWRSTKLNPKFQSVDASACATTGDWNASSGSATDTFYLTYENSQNEAQKSPFVVGEAIRFYDIDDAEDLPVHTTSASDVRPKITKISFTSGSGIQIVLDKSVYPQIKMGTRYLAATPSVVGGDVCIYSVSNDGQALGQAASYTVKNSHLVLQTVSVGSAYETEMIRKMKEGGTITYDFLSTTNYKYSQIKSDTVANIRLPINNARCRSIIGIPTDATRYSLQQVLNASSTYENRLDTDAVDDFLNQQRVGLEGCSDYLTDYQFLYDGKLQPSRRVDVSKTSSKVSISAQHLIELSKALSQAGIDGHSLKKFDTNFCIGRALSLGSGVYDARNRDFNLQLNYAGITPTKNKLWNFFVFHIRRLEISGESVRVII
tara:strand:- start:854 stop:2671 length:1818 start_codon:yes stop_codon:yes gene_type:complete